MVKENKRERLIQAAITCFYHQGVHRTTLADVAQESDVPLGNVYYHFRTKEALIQAVISSYVLDLQAGFARLESLPDPLARLKSFVSWNGTSRSQLLNYGCPYGSLCQELGKENGEAEQAVSELLRIQVTWVTQQFRQLGKGDDEAYDLAIDLMSSIQGIRLLVYTLRSSDVLMKKLERLLQWLDTIQ